MALAERAGARGAEDRFELILSLVEFLCARLARTGASGTSPPDIIAGEAMALVRLAATPNLGRIWADLGAKLPGKARQAQALNLDGASVLLDMMIECERDVARFVQP